MNRISPTVLISLCLVCVTIGAMLAGQAIVGLTPDKGKEVFEARKTLSENLAVQYSLLAASGQTTTIETAMRALVERNAEILSAALQTADGQPLAAAGDHLRYWVQPSGQRSTPTHIQVPIYKGAMHWELSSCHFVHWEMCRARNSMKTCGCDMCCWSRSWDSSDTSRL